MTSTTCIPVAILMLMVAMPSTAQTAATEQSTPKDEGWDVRWDGHPELEWPGKLRVEFHARIQSDRHTTEDATAEDGRGERFEERRRLGFEGEIADVVEFQVERELGSRSPWRDAFIIYRPTRSAAVQAGRFKLPFGLEETTSRTTLDFINRSLISDRLAPGRDYGLMVQGRIARKMLGYEVGMFVHDGDNARPNGGRRVFGGRTLAGRLTVEPFRRSKSTLSDFQLGAAFTGSSLPEGFSAIRGRSALGVLFFPSEVWVNGSRQRAGLQARWRPGPFSIASEFIRVSDARRGQSQESTDLPSLLARGWYVSGAWVVAGARRAGKAAEPDRPLFHGGFGSIQVALRLEQLSLGSASGTEPSSTSPRAASVLGNADTATTLGLAWHPNRWVTIEGNLIRETIGDVARDSYPPMRFWSRLVRFQFAI